ncbi:MAG TPA: phage tail protein, partial [Pseudomonas sp.]|nr:phage tail protein [Pseudomonas sp.]
GGEKLSNSLIHLTALADDDKAFWVRGVAFYLADGTLFAVWSSTGDPLTYKPKSGEILLAYDLSLEALPADSVTIVSSSAGLNLTLAAPLAAQAAAMLAIEVRHLVQGDELALQTEKLRIVGAYLADVTSRLSGLETRQATNRDEILAAVASNAAAVIALQNQFVQHVHGA